MPLYEYRCNPCGEFEAWRTLAEYNAPMNCPSCSQPALKIISAPNVNLNSGSLSAIASDSEPKLVRRETKEPTQPRYQSSSSSRPWMVGHTSPRY